jgi:alpha-L-fucosidase
LLPKGGTVKAKAFINGNTQSSETVREDFDVAPALWSVVSPEIRGMERAIDGNFGTACILPDNQTSIIINLGETLSLNGFSYYPIDGSGGNIYRYAFYISPDGKKWERMKNNATFDNIKNNPIPQFVRFENPIKANFIKLEAIETVEPGQRVSIGEIGVISKY